MASARLIRSASTKKIPSVGNHQDEPNETQPLLGQSSEDHDVESTENPPIKPQDPKQRHPFKELPIYKTIWRIRREITANIIDPYSLEQLRAPRLNSTVVRPLMQRFYNLEDISIVYCLLVNRVQFLREQSYQAHYQSVNTARALLCEILAIKLLRQYDEDSSGRKGLLLLANVLIVGFEPFQNCPDDLHQHVHQPASWAYLDGKGERHMAALEIAIISESKLFLSSPACQRVVDAIYVGFVIYTPTSFINLIPDHYKHQPISLYDPRKARILNQYRLVVPRTRNAIEIGQFIVLLALYIFFLAKEDRSYFSIRELIFCIYTLGWILDQLAAVLEHGWEVYSQNLWSFLDVAFSMIYLVYFGMRIHSLRVGDPEAMRHAMDWLAMGAPFLIPRLAFNVFSENILFVALREMMSQFFLLTFLAIWSFAGFFLAMSWVGEGYDSPWTIGKWMVYVWFGLDGTGIERSGDFHWLLGPLLMISFAILGNTLFLTILVSALSSTFSNILRHSAAEVQFRRAVLTLQSVKSDAIFSYQPPFNLLAFVILVPLKFVISPRWFHKVHISAVKLLNAPLLLLISWLERHSLADWVQEDERVTRRHRQHTRKKKKALLPLSQLHPYHGDILEVFEHEPAESELDEGSDNGQEDNDDADNDNDSEDENHSPKSNGHASLNDNEPDIEDDADKHRAESPDDKRQESKTSRRSSEARPSPGPRRKSSVFGMPTRRETVWSEGGAEAQMAGILTDQESSSADIVAKIQGLERGMKRLEKLVKQVLESVEEEGDDEAEGSGNVE